MKLDDIRPTNQPKALKAAVSVLDVSRLDTSVDTNVVNGLEDLVSR